MKNAIIFHGKGGTPESYWHPWLKCELEDNGYKVWVPQLPDKDEPDLKTWLLFALKNGQFDCETVLIGHSAGCPLILSILEKIEIKIAKAIMVAGFIESLTGEVMPILQEKYDWEKIKSHCGEFIFINSDNDPWGCDDRQGKKMADSLGGKLIVLHEGHMGSERFNQPYKEFPFLRNLIG